MLLPRLWLADICLRTGREKEAVRRLKEIIDIGPEQVSMDDFIIKRDVEVLLRKITGG